MIICDLVEHIEQDEEVIYIFKNLKGGRVCVYVVEVIDCEMVTLSKEYKTREAAMLDIKMIERKIKSFENYDIH